MAWFSKKQPAAVAEPEQASSEKKNKKKVVTGPRLAVLTPDIAGISSFRLSLTDDAPEAESMIATLRADVRRGTHAFWAMHDRPVADESMHVETLVLIRAKTDSDLVYVVSFLDLDSALSFTRFEVRRGLYIGNVMIYWAAFAQVREEIEGVSIIPSIAPASDLNYVAPEPRLAPPLPQASAAVAEPVAKPEPELESIAEAEARKAVERYLEENPERAAEPVAEQPAIIEDRTAVLEPPVVEKAPDVGPALPIYDDEPVSEEAAVADALVLQHPPVAEPAVEVEPEAAPEPQAEPAAAEPSPYVYDRQPAQFTPKRRWSAREERQDQPELVAEAQSEVVAQTQPDVLAEAQPELVAEARSEVVAEAQPEVIAEAPQVIAEAPQVTAEEPVAETAQVQEPVVARPPESLLQAHEHEALQAIAGRLATQAADEEAEREAAIEAIQIEATAPAVDPANGLPQSEKYNEFDIALEVERLLKNRKWESREGPFRGFKSPPGRF